MDNQLPAGWRRTTLGSIAEWGSGGTPSRRNSEFFRGNIPWVKTGELTGKYVRDSEEKISVEGLQKSSAKLFPAGSVGIAMYGATIGKLSIFAIDATTNQACAVAIPNKDMLHNEFLYYFLLSEKQKLIDSGKGGAQPNISQGLLKSWPIALPDVPEQKCIVAKIEELFSELDNGIKSLKTAREQLKIYRQSLLKHAFEGKLTEQWRKENTDKLKTPEQLLTRIQQEREVRYQQQLKAWELAVKEWKVNGEKGKKPGRPKQITGELEPFVETIKIPPVWSTVTLEMLNADIFDGPFGSNLKSSDYVDQGVRVIRLENVGHMEFIEDKYSYVTEEKYKEIKKHTVYSGDIIFSSFITEGIRAIILPDKIDRAINKADCFCIRVHGTFYLTEFLAWYLSSRGAYRQVESEIHGIGRPRINTTQLKRFLVPLCSVDEQKEVISRVKNILAEADRMDDSLEAEIQRSEAFRQSILKKAFSGELCGKSS
ncbi:restriction endonuclease subunit S [Methylobacillus sp.]|uniref:restriction endonuclease subunit S n=1 Tax=Methylobacillus sp. TaxID=56818 RepID=UPI002FE08409